MPSTKFSLLALASTAAAVPHYAQHARFHKPSGGYGTNNQTMAAPTAAGAGDATTLMQTEYSTATIVSTIYAQRPSSGAEGAASAGADAVSTDAAACGPATVYVTATEQVTVTVGAGASSSSAPAADSSAAAVASSAPAASYGGGYSAAVPSSAAAEAATSAAPAASYGAGYSAPAVSSAAAVESSVAPVASSAAAVVSSAAAVSSAPASSAAVVASSAAASSATPSQSSTPSYSGGKRGVSYAKADVAMCGELESKPAWKYDWESVDGSDGSNSDGITFYPTMHGLDFMSFLTTDQWFSDVSNAAEKGAKVVFGFNEPDQAGQSVDSVCSAWKEYMNPLKEKHSDMTIVGPSVTNGQESNKGLNWLQQFQDGCTDATWDEVNIHWYWNYEENLVEKLQAQVEAAAKQTGKKVWVTEFGLNDDVATDEQAAAFISDCTKYLEGASEVAGYSYFKVGNEKYNLNSASTSLVSAYAS